MLNVKLWKCGNMKLWKYENVANVASVANTNAQYQLGIGNIGIGNIPTLATFNNFGSLSEGVRLY